MTSLSRAPLVTVVTPCLNPGPRLGRCLESVRAQGYRHIEHIIVDGGSTDGTVEELEKTSERWISESDSGQANAINKGFRMARGEIVGWLNADDSLTEGAIEAVVEAFAASESPVQWVYGDVLIVDGLQRRRERPGDPRRPISWAARNIAAQPGSFHTAEAIEEVGGLDESFQFMMDLELWLRMIDAGMTARYVPRILAAFEVHPSSKSGSISHAEFVEEEARARIKNGRIQTGAVALGRLVAWRAFDNGNLDRLEAEVDGILNIPWVSEVDVPRRVVEAAASAEAAVLLSKQRRVAGALKLLSMKPWAYRETRARISDAASREVKRLLHRCG